MPKTPPSINGAGGIVAFLNLPEVIPRNNGKTGADLVRIMEMDVSDTTKLQIIKDEFKKKSWKTRHGWMERYRRDNV